MIGYRLLSAAARILLPRGDREVIVGDLLELHAVRRGREGRWRAGVGVVRDLLASALGARAPGRRPPGGRRPTRPVVDLPGDLLRDVRIAARSLARDRGWSAVTVVTLALGIGSVAAVFGMVNQLVLRPLPGVTDPGGAAYLQFRSREHPEQIQGHGLSTLDFDVLRGAATFVDGIASYGNVTLYVSVGEGRPLDVWANTVYGDYFDVLGARPAEGRLLGAEDTGFGADPLVAVISGDLRDRLFGPGATATGRTLRVNDSAVRILGVAADGFQGAERGGGQQMWVPYTALVPLIGFTEELLLDRNSTMHYDVVLRVRPEIGAAGVEAGVDSILARIARAVPEESAYLAGLRPTLFPGLTTPPLWRAMTRRTLVLLAGVVALVLLVACANVANLLLFRNVSRRGGAAVRRALGASSSRIARGHLVQSLLLAGLGSAAGLGVAWLISLALRGQSLLRMPALEVFTLDARVLAFAAAAAVATTVLFGTVPALLAGRFDLGGALRSAGRAETAAGARLRTVVAAGQVALSLALLVGSVMLTRTVANLYAVDTGLDDEGVATLALELPRRYGPEEEIAAREAIVSALRAVPGVEGVAVGLYGPYGSTLLGRIARADASDAEALRTEMAPITAGWLDVLGVRALDGSALALDEDAWLPGRVVLTASLAGRLFGAPERAVGRTVRVGFRALEDARVVAVTSELRDPRSPDESRDALFVPLTTSIVSITTVAVRAAPLDPSTLRAIRAAVEGALPDVPVRDAEPLADRLDEIHSERRVFSRLISLLSAFAIALAAVGLYGVVAFTVTSRARELGVRIALGADAPSIAGLVARHAASIVGIGTLLGLALGYALARVLESRLFGLAPLDVGPYALAAVVLAGAAALACWVPTRRAIRVDPATTLRSD